MAELYPDCVVKARTATNPSDKDIEDVTRRTMNACFFSK